MSLFTSLVVRVTKASMLLLTTAALCNRYDVKDAYVYTSCSPYLHGVAALKLTRSVRPAELDDGNQNKKQQCASAVAEQEPQVPFQYTLAAHLLSLEGAVPTSIIDRFPAALRNICPDFKDAEQVIDCYRRSTWADTWAVMAANDRMVLEREKLRYVLTPKELLEQGWGI